MKSPTNSTLQRKILLVLNNESANSIAGCDFNAETPFGK